jgi:chromosome segregation ATPase
LISLLIDIWPCLAIAALMGVAAGWMVWGRNTNRIVASYRGRLAKVRGNWETVEEQLAQALARSSALQQERDTLKKEWSESQVTLHEREEAWKQERRLLDETVRQLNQRLVRKSSPRRSSASSPSKRDLGP